MPPAKRSTSTRARRSSAFKPPAALANLNKSIDSAEKALAQLSKHGGSQSARDVYKGLKKFVTTARRDSGKFAKAIQRDVEQAQKTVAKSSRSARARATSAARSRTTAAKSTRTTAAKSTAAKSTRSTAAKSTRSTAAKSTARKTTAAKRPQRAAAKRTTKRSG
jgi:DNA-binding SARP family transcriptional activator